MERWRWRAIRARLRRKNSGRAKAEIGFAPPLKALTDAQARLLIRVDEMGMPAWRVDQLLAGRSIDLLTENECVALRVEANSERIDCGGLWDDFAEDVPELRQDVLATAGEAVRGRPPVAALEAGPHQEEGEVT